MIHRIGFRHGSPFGDEWCSDVAGTSFLESIVGKAQYGLSMANKIEAELEGVWGRMLRPVVSTGDVAHRETHGYVDAKH